MTNSRAIYKSLATPYATWQILLMPLGKNCTLGFVFHNHPLDNSKTKEEFCCILCMVYIISNLNHFQIERFILAPLYHYTHQSCPLACTISSHTKVDNHTGSPSNLHLQDNEFSTSRQWWCEKLTTTHVSSTIPEVHTCYRVENILWML